MSPLIRPPWSRSSGGRWISAQPVPCSTLRLAILFLLENGGSAFWREIENHLLKHGVRFQTAKGARIMLKNYNFVREEKNKRFVLSDWVYKILEDKNSKEDMLLTLATGILSGGYSSRIEPTGELMGTRLMIYGLRKISAKGHNMISLEELALEIGQKDVVAINCIKQLLDQPTTEKDPYALGIIESVDASDPKRSLIRFDGEIEERLRAYQVSIMSKYLCHIISRIIQEKYGVEIKTAIEKNLNIINVQAIREALRDFPEIWVDENERDELVRKVTEDYYNYVWWSADRAVGGVGLSGDQGYTYLKVTKEPFYIPLKNPYHFDIIF